MTTTAEALGGATDRLRASGSETARLDAELLLGWAIGVDRTAVVAHPDAPVGADALARFEAAIERRAAGEPVAYIRGLKEFHGLAFTVDARALIPRDLRTMRSGAPSLPPVPDEPAAELEAAVR